MTIVSPGTVSCGSGGARSTVLVSPKKRELKTYQSRRSLGGCPGGAAGSRSQEKAANSERPDGPYQEPAVAVVDVGLPPPRVQEPAKPKRGGCDASGMEISWAAKKQRSAVAGASERWNTVAEVNGAAAASASSSIVQEPAGVWVSLEIICKKDRRSHGGSAGAFMVERKDEKHRPCTFAAPVPALNGMRQDSEACFLIEKRCPDTAVASEGGNGVMDQVRMAGPSTPPLEIHETLLVREAKAAARQCHKIAKHYDCKTTKQPFMNLSSRLQCLGITNVTTVLAKVLTPTDCNLNQSRLQLQPSFVVDSPLMIMLTPYEDRAVHREDNLDGLQLEALDRHGCSYNMTFKFLESIGAYRLIGEWAKFLAQNGVRSGDLFELGAFRFEGRLVLTLMHHAKEDQALKETETAESSKEVQILKEMEENGGVVQEGTSEEIEAAEGAEKWTREEMEAAEIMMELSDFKDG